MYQSDIKTMVYGKKETVSGVEEPPSAAADVFKVIEPTLKGFVAQTESENEAKEYLGNSEQFVAGVFAELEFKMYITGAGVAGDAPNWAFWHLLCGYAQTLNALVDARYNLVGGNTDTATIYVNKDGNRHPIIGCRGEVSRHFEADKLAYFKYKMVGVFGDPVAKTTIAPDWSTLRTPSIVGKANTAVVTLHGEALGISSLSYANNNTLESINVPGYQGVDIDDRAPSGDVTFIAPLVTAKNWWTACKARDKGILIVEQGTVEGDIVRFENPNVQVFNPESTKILGAKAGLKLSLNPMPTIAGNDEDLIIVK